MFVFFLGLAFRGSSIGLLFVFLSHRNLRVTGRWTGGKERRRRASSQVITAGPSSLVVVAVLQVLALDVTPAVVSAWQLHAIFVHAPADASFPATGGLALQGGGL